MKFFLDRVDRFCAAHPRFGIPKLMLYVVVGNAVVWLFSMFTALSGAGSGILEALYFSPYHILHGQVWRLVTFIIIPNSSGILALIFFYFYYMIGRTVEAQWGAGKFTVYFFTGVLLTVLYGFFCYFVFHVNMAVSAQFIYLSLFFGLILIHDAEQIPFVDLVQKMDILQPDFIPVDDEIIEVAFSGRQRQELLGPGCDRHIVHQLFHIHVISRLSPRLTSTCCASIGVCRLSSVPMA